jgi:hypothetical protein
VTNLRKLDWRSYGINFIMVFSPNVFRAAPYAELFTIAYGAPEGRDALDTRLARETAGRFPQVVSIRVREAIAAIDKIASQLALAARAAAAIAIVTAILALASALASGQRARLHDAVVLKTLGATRGWLLFAYGADGSRRLNHRRACGRGRRLWRHDLSDENRFRVSRDDGRRHLFCDACDHDRPRPTWHMARVVAPPGAGIARIVKSLASAQFGQALVAVFDFGGAGRKIRNLAQGLVAASD